MELQPIVDALIGVCATVITVVGVILAKYWAREIEKRIEFAQAGMDEGQRALLWNIARVGVNAAEQLGLSGQIEDKKEYAIKYVTDYLHSRGVNFPVEQVVTQIEAAVWEEINGKSNNGVNIPLVGEICSETGDITYRRGGMLKSDDTITGCCNFGDAATDGKDEEEITNGRVTL